MVDKVSLTNIANLQNETTVVDAINANNAAITAAMTNTLSRDGILPNQMTASLDMNSQRILNLPTPVSNYEPVRIIDRTSLNAGVPITVSPLPAGGSINQVLTKNSSTNFDVSWKTAAIVTPEQFGYTTYGTGDAGTAINSAIASVSGPVRVFLGEHTYNIVTPIVISKF